ncbi:MAG: hypothetical protein M4D80_19410 [Myxococcota bacterium]|nr:hypothetical protein [Myxococcota bacterium]
MRFLQLVIAAVMLLAAPRLGETDTPVPLVVVVAKGSKIVNLTKADLRRCFSGESVEAGGQRLVPFNTTPSSVERVAFDRAILAMSPEQVGRYWVDRKIRGQGQPPRALPSAQYVAKIVAKFRGAIGYIPRSQLTSDVQVVTIDGVAPGAAGYPLYLK